MPTVIDGSDDRTDDLMRRSKVNTRGFRAKRLCLSCSALPPSDTEYAGALENSEIADPWGGMEGTDNDAREAIVSALESRSTLASGTALPAKKTTIPFKYVVIGAVIIFSVVRQCTG